MNKIYIQSGKSETDIAILKNGELEEYLIEKKENKRKLGNIYRARVEDVLEGMQSAFVDIGEEKNAYLYLTDALTQHEKSIGKKYFIKDLLKPGEEVIAQVKKEALDGKGAKITTNIRLPGKYITLTPFRNKVSFSSSIKDKEVVASLSLLGEEVKNKKVGLMFKKESKGIGKKLIEKEYKMLFDTYKEIEKQRHFLPTPKLLYEAGDLIYKTVRDIYIPGKYKIIVNGKEAYDRVTNASRNLGISIGKDIIKDTKLNFKYNESIQKGLKVALSRRVNLKSGGSIVIDETEALTAIDVNTGKSIGKLSFQETILQTNLEAAYEVAKQIKLRNLGGIIIIDFIDLKSAKDKEEMLGNLKKAFSEDDNRPNLVGITRLGLVEVTRKKEGASLSDYMCFDCETCKGLGKTVKKDWQYNIPLIK